MRSGRCPWRCKSFAGNEGGAAADGERSDGSELSPEPARLGERAGAAEIGADASAAFAGNAAATPAAGAKLEAADAATDCVNAAGAERAATTGVPLKDAASGVAESEGAKE